MDLAESEASDRAAYEEEIADQIRFSCKKAVRSWGKKFEKDAIECGATPLEFFVEILAATVVGYLEEELRLPMEE